MPDPTTDDTPKPPKRTRKRSTAKAAKPDLIGVMAPDADPEPPLPDAGSATAEGGEAEAGAASEASSTGTAATAEDTPPAEEETTTSADDAAASAAAEDAGDKAAGQASGPELPDTVLRVERGGIGQATAGSVEVHLGGIGALEASDVFVEWGGVGAARADTLSVEFGSVGASLTGEMRLTQGYAGAIAAREATIEQGLVRTLIAQQVTINRPTGVLVMIAQRVSGDVRPVLDWRGALAVGAAFAVVSVLLRAVRQRD